MSFIRKSSVYLLSNIINAAIPFILLPFLTRYLSTAEYGAIAIFQTIISGLVSIIAFNSLGATARIYYDECSDDFKRSYNGACFCLLVISLALLLPFTAFISSSVITYLGIKPAWLYVAIVVAGMNFVIQFRLNQWQVRGNALSYGFLQISQSALLFVLSIIFVVLMGGNAQGRVDANIFALLIVLFFVSISIYKDNLLSFKGINRKIFEDIFGFSLPLIPHVFGMYLLSSVDRFFINSELGADQAGIYMVAVQLSMGMVIVFDAVNKAFMPWLFNELANKKYSDRKHIAIKTYYYFAFLIAVGFAAYFISPRIIITIAGEKFNEAKEVIGWLCFGQVFLGMYLMVTNYIFYAKKTGQLSVLTLVCGGFNVFLLIFLMHSHGIKGVAIAFCISMCIRFLGTWWLAYKTKLIPWF